MSDNNKNKIHDAPWLTIRNPEILATFCARFGINICDGWLTNVNNVVAAFMHVPYENLTKILKADSVISATSAMRYPDEVLGDFLKWGSGGTCFSLTAAVVAVFDAIGISAYPILADRHYGADTHCGLLIAKPDGELLLLDPGYLLFAPVSIPKDLPVQYDNVFNTIELKPICGAQKIELYTLVKGNRKLRLTFKMTPVSDAAFGHAWEQSFAFEMMTYPVLTRCENGCHQYLQGNVLAVRNAQHTERIVLTKEKQIEFIETVAGIDRNIVTRALEIVNYGINSSAASR